MKISIELDPQNASDLDALVRLLGGANTLSVPENTQISSGPLPAFDSSKVQVWSTAENAELANGQLPDGIQSVNRSAEPKAAEPKAAEPKAAEPKAAEPKAAEPKPKAGGFRDAINGKFNPVDEKPASPPEPEQEPEQPKETAKPTTDEAIKVKGKAIRELFVSINSQGNYTVDDAKKAVCESLGIENIKALADCNESQLDQAIEVLGGLVA